ncbi:dipeptide epimerase [Caulobacter sp. CCNWLY153]|uniref:Dipeptide epimerase n=1 Tax=Caulobacter radicis TaxID=2172650 RepID=A0A2T9JMA9_9CAUL|nr:dipeptide epimerase [Caulobacter radicis]PVM84798.1 dipeptide epimerase [Caulobacter radicis]
MTRRQVAVTVEALPFRQPLRIAGRTVPGIPGVRVTIAQDGARGRGEAGGVFYLDDDTGRMVAEIDRVRGDIEAGADRLALQTLLPGGGARNALDAALWELESRLTREPVWRLAGLVEPRPRITTYTLGAETPEVLRADLAAYADARAIKLKLDGDLPADIARIRQVRAARPDVWLMVDANQGYCRDTLMELSPVLVEADVRLLEQPFPIGREAVLDDLALPVPVAADESLQGLADLPGLVGRFQVANIKLDKCGGLTEALAMVGEARRLGLGVMVGNMGGSSLAAAPAYLLAQLCDHVDLDGPKFLAHDLPGGVTYAGGAVSLDREFWG